MKSSTRAFILAILIFLVIACNGQNGRNLDNSSFNGNTGTTELSTGTEQDFKDGNATLVIYSAKLNSTSKFASFRTRSESSLAEVDKIVALVEYTQENYIVTEEDLDGTIHISELASNEFNRESFLLSMQNKYKFVITAIKKANDLVSILNDKTSSILKAHTKKVSDVTERIAAAAKSVATLLAAEVNDQKVLFIINNAVKKISQNSLQNNVGLSNNTDGDFEPFSIPITKGFPLEHIPILAVKSGSDDFCSNFHFEIKEKKLLFQRISSDLNKTANCYFQAKFPTSLIINFDLLFTKTIYDWANSNTASVEKTLADDIMKNYKDIPLQIIQEKENFQEKMPNGLLAGLKDLTDLVFQDFIIEPEALLGLKNLKNLTFRRSIFGEINTNTFTVLTSLQKLNFADCIIADIKGSPFSELKSLQDLTISGMSSSFTMDSYNENHADKDNLLPHMNNIIIGENTFKGLIALNTLTISSNPNLAAIQPSAFNELGNLQTLEISANPNLAIIEPYAFTGLTSLQILQIYDNNGSLELKADAFGAGGCPSNVTISGITCN